MKQESQGDTRFTKKKRQWNTLCSKSYIPVNFINFIINKISFSQMIISAL